VLDAGGYLIDAMFEAGPTMANPMGGELPMDWPAAWAYGQATGAISEPWEYRALIDLSRAYLSAKIAGADPLAMPPTEQVTDDRFC
jgi:hypothetical protein